MCEMKAVMGKILKFDHFENQTQITTKPRF